MKNIKKILILGLVFVMGIAVIVGCSPKKEVADKNKGKNIEEIASTIVTDLSTGDYAKAADDFDYTAKMKKVVTAQAYEDLWKQQETQLGPFVKINGTKVENYEENFLVRVQCVFEKGGMDLQITFDSANIIAGIFIKEYSGDQAFAPIPETIKEKSITFGEDAFLLSGTLTTPKEGENFPCVILVHGSGPQDQDETIGPNKPFRDIAWELATQGIASVRYDKRTKTYAKTMGEAITPKEETIDDVIYALDYALNQPEINENNIFIAGHSLGGYLMPKIAEVTPQVAGYIILAGSTSPLEDIIVRQNDYLSGLDGVISNEEADAITTLKTAWNKIKNLTPESTNQKTELMGINKEYWLYLKDYKPIEVMATVEKPILILQGEGDYQVEMSEFNAWKTGISDKENVTLKSYPNLNHLFILGNASKSPQEYLSAGKVSQDVINDIAKFVKENSEESQTQ